MQNIKQQYGFDIIEKQQPIGFINLFLKFPFIVFLNVSGNFPKFGLLVIFNPFHCNILHFPLPIQFMFCRLGKQFAYYLTTREAKPSILLCPWPSPP